MWLSCREIQPLADIDQQAENMFSQMVKQMATQEDITEQLKADSQIEWVGRMNNIRQRTEEIINTELIYSWIQYCKWAALQMGIGVPLTLVIGIFLEPILFLPLAHLTEHPIEWFDPLPAEFG